MIGLFICAVSHIVDGDTIACSDGTRVRIAGIDAPEIHGCPHWRQCTPGDGQASKRNMISLTQGRTLQCNNVGRSYNRIIAHCYLNGQSIGCTQVRSGYAVLRYSEKAKVCG